MATYFILFQVKSYFVPKADSKSLLVLKTHDEEPELFQKVKLRTYREENTSVNKQNEKL